MPLHHWLAEAVRWIGHTRAGELPHRQKRTNDTHASKTDPEAKLYRKGHGQEARLSYLGHLLMENRNGLIVDAMVTEADGTAERDAAMLMVHKRWKKRQPIRSLGADKAYDTRGFVKILREMQVRPHVTQNLNRAGGSAIDARTTRHVGYRISQKRRPRIERAFGWMNSVGGIRKVKLRGLLKVDWLFLMTAAAFNLWRIPKLKLAGA
jgi:IS5 family transposase